MKVLADRGDEMTQQYTYFVADGPYPTQDKYGDEYPVWVTAGMDEDDCEIKAVEYSSRDAAIDMLPEPPISTMSNS